MKALIKKLAQVAGYRIGRISAQNDADAALQYLLRDVDRPTVFDVGAHHGETALKFRSLFPNSTVFAFEPFPETFRRLRANTAADDGIRTFDFGLSDRDGTQPFSSNTSSATNSLLETDQAGRHTWGDGVLETSARVDAQFRQLDTVLATLQLRRIDLLKLDVQGSESLVMAGAKLATQARAIRLIYAEIITQPTYQGQPRLDEALAVFYRAGFDLFNIFDSNHAADGRLRQFDALFTQKVQ